MLVIYIYKGPEAPRDVEVTVVYNQTTSLLFEGIEVSWKQVVS